MFTLRRTSGEALALTREHDAIAEPRRGEVHWDSFDRRAHSDEALDHAAALWRTRAEQEMHSLALFTDLAASLQVLGAPLDWSGAFARMIGDEVRHTDLCLRMCDVLGRPAMVAIDEAALHAVAKPPTRAGVRRAIVSAFCVGETISGRMFRRAHRVATVPVAREVVAAIVVDETFHGELGWELGALVMRDDDAQDPANFAADRDALAGELPRLFADAAELCGAVRGPSWARAEAESDAGDNFGTLSLAGYARAFFDGMEEDVVPGLVAIGLPEAKPVYEALVRDLDARA